MGEMLKALDQALIDLKNGVLPKMINGIVQEKPKERDPGEDDE